MRYYEVAMFYLEAARNFCERHQLMMTILALAVLLLNLILYEASRQVDEFTVDYPEEE